MRNIDLGHMSLEELKALHKDVTVAIDTYRDRQRDEARKVLEEKARELGFKLDELASAPGGRRKGKSGPARYRHPENPALTWTGRGRRPNWVVAALEQGRSLDDLRI
ncbi:MAG: H-NS histone family protein [Alkalilacustris sp.]